MKGIIKFGPNRVWRTYLGGKLLNDMENRPDVPDNHFPEDWIGSVVQARNTGREDIVEGLTILRSEGKEPVSFRSVLLSDPKYFLGETNGKNRSIDDIPLVKFLDSATRLHFQVHPSRDFAQQRLGCARGKTEAYVILAIREEVESPYIYAGFQRPPSRAQLKSWIQSQDITSIERCFDKIPVRPGDVFLLPGGRPHALGEGILMLEIMEPSDLAVRFEFERCGYVIPEAARFMNRDIETALDVFNLSPVEAKDINHTFRCEPQVYFENELGCRLEGLIGPHQTSCFIVNRAVVKDRFERHEKACFYGIVVQGKGSIQTSSQTLELGLWDRFFCPAGEVDFTYFSERGMTILECFPGND